MKVTATIYFHTASVPTIIEGVATYQKGDLYCVKVADGHYKKFPIANIFSIDEVHTTG